MDMCVLFIYTFNCVFARSLFFKIVILHIFWIVILLYFMYLRMLTWLFSSGERKIKRRLPHGKSLFNRLPHYLYLLYNCYVWGHTSISTKLQVTSFL